MRFSGILIGGVRSFSSPSDDTMTSIGKHDSMAMI